MDLVYFAILCSVLIFVHELGHFFWAKIFGVKVLTFSIGFGPKIIRLRGRETEYCVALLPLGGFVKMLEETREETILPEDKKRTFESQALWKRIIIVLAGPAMNILFPVLCYFTLFVTEQDSAPPTIGVVMPGHPAEGKLLPGDRVLEINGEKIFTFSDVRRIVNKNPGTELNFKLFRGRDHVDVSLIPAETRAEKPLEIVDIIGEIGVRPNQPAAVIGVPQTSSPAYRAGLRTFDVIIEVRGRSLKTFAELEAILLENRGENVPVGYLRPVRVPHALGTLGDFAVFESGVAALTPDNGNTLLARTGIELGDPYVFDVPEGSAEWNADLRPGDRIISVDGVEISAWSMFKDRLFAARDKSHRVEWERQGQRKSGTIELRRELWIDEYGQERPRYDLRASNWSPTVPEPPVEGPPSIRHAISASLDETYDVVRFILVGIVRILEGKVSLSTLGGPITIYDIVGEESAKGVSYFVWAMAVISINLGLINLLPIPVLDGGHLVFFVFEAIFRRPLSLRVREVASFAGMLVVVALMAVAFKNDVERRWDVIVAQFRELVN